MSTERKLAEMSPDELWKEYDLASDGVRACEGIHALIQRATREAREGYVPEGELVTVTVACDEARTRLAEAERTLAGAKVEGAREALTRVQEMGQRGEWSRTPDPQSPYRPHWMEIAEFTKREYPAPVEAAPSVPTFTVGTHGNADHCSACGFIERTVAWSQHVWDAHSLTVKEWEKRGGKQVVPEAAPQAAVPWRIGVQEYGGEAFVRFIEVTPAIAKQIVALATGGGR